MNDDRIRPAWNEAQLRQALQALAEEEPPRPLPDPDRIWRASAAASELAARRALAARAARPAAIGQAAGTGLAVAGTAAALALRWDAVASWLRSLPDLPPGSAGAWLLALACTALVLAGALRTTRTG
jgi:hypothetical protein